MTTIRNGLHRHTMVNIAGFTVMFFLLISNSSLLYAEPDQSKQELIELIRSVEADIESEQSELEQVKRTSEENIESIQQKQSAAANDLVSTRRDIHNLEQKLNSLNEKKNSLTNEIETLRTQVDQARNLFPVLRSMIRRWTENVPPSRKQSEHQSALREATELMESEGKPVQAVNKCINVIISLLRESRQAQFLTTTIRTPDGQKRDVELLRAGRTFVAYRTPDGKRYGIRVNGENGYRWQTDLTGDQKERINQSIETLTSEQKASRSFTSFVLPLDPTQEMTRDQRGTRKTFIERIYAGGPVMIPLALIALIALVLILERFWTLRREQTDVNTLLRNVQSDLQEGDFDGAIGHCEQRSGAVSSVLKTLIKARNEPAETTQDRVEEAILQQMPRLERFLPSLNVLAGVAPLLGLLGTVTGIIETFDVIAVFGAGNQQLMAGGISEALMTTATGLVIAIPILLCHGYFRSRVDTIVGNMERTAATIYNFLKSEPEEEEFGEPDVDFS